MPGRVATLATWSTARSDTARSNSSSEAYTTPGTRMPSTYPTGISHTNGSSLRGSTGLSSLVHVGGARPRHVPGPRQADLGRAGAGPVGVEPEPRQPGPDLGAAVAPAPRQGQDARDQGRRGHGLGLQLEDRLAARAAAGGLLVLAGGTA